MEDLEWLIPFFDITIFKNFTSFKKWFEIHNEDVNNFEELGDKVLVQPRSELLDHKTELYGTLENHNVSIAIASCITAYARIHMSQFKNNPNFNLYYTDTDSIYIDKPLPDHMVDSKILGKMKLENISDKAIFLAPKVYCLKTINQEFIYKIKGLSHDIELTYQNFDKLLTKNSVLEKIQNKFFRKLTEGHIHTLNQIYTLQLTENKRQLIFDDKNKFINTNSFIIDNKKDIRK